MNKIKILLALLLVSNWLLAQEEIRLNLDVPCTNVENFEPHLKFPLEVDERVDLKINWMVSKDSIVEERTSARFRMNEVINDLLFTGFFGASVMDINTGEILHFGDDRFMKSFEKDELILLTNYDTDITHFISLTSGDTLHSVKSYTSVFGYEFFDDSLYYGSTRGEMFAYSLNQKKKMWKVSDVELPRYHNYFGSEGSDIGMMFYHEYDNFRADSSFRKMYYVSPEDWKMVEVKVEDPYVGFSAVEDSVIYFYGRNNKYYSVSVPEWKVNWCVEGNWKWPFFKKKGEWIAVNHEVNVATGEITRTNNYSWNKTFAVWGDYYVLTAFDGDVNHLFLSTQDFEEIYRINFVYDQKLPCDLDLVIYDNKIRFASTKDLNNSVAYFNCNGKTHFIGIKLLLDTVKEYE